MSLKKKFHDFVEANRAQQTKPLSTTAMLTDCFICNNYPPRNTPPQQSHQGVDHCFACDTYPPLDQRVSHHVINGIAPSAVNNGYASSAVGSSPVVRVNDPTGPVSRVNDPSNRIAAPAIPSSVPVAPPLSPELKALELANQQQPEEPFYTLKSNVNQQAAAPKPKYSFEVPVKVTVEQPKPELVLQTSNFRP